MLFRALLLIGLVLGATAAAAEERPLFQLVRQPEYLAAWKTMVAGTTVPDWVAAFAQNPEGPNVPSVDVLSNGRIFTLGMTCKPNECGDHQLYVLFTPNASQAWGMLLEGDRRTWLGNPDPSIQEVILSRVE